jgi:hypothetical protein
MPLEPAAWPGAEGRVATTAVSAPIRTASNSGVTGVPGNGWPVAVSGRASTEDPVSCVGRVIHVVGPCGRWWL